MDLQGWQVSMVEKKRGQNPELGRKKSRKTEGEAGKSTTERVIKDQAGPTEKEGS